VARFDVTDAEWALIEPHLPVAATAAGARSIQRDPVAVPHWIGLA
jgi:transposase